jgi:uncharacterized protein YkwD
MRSFLAVAAVLCTAIVCASSARADGDPYAALLAPAGTCGPAENTQTLDRQTAVTTMLCFTNYARAQSTLPPLQLNATLSDAGDAKLAADMSCGVFSHEPCGQPFDSVFKAYLAGAASFEIGENIAWGSGDYASPRSIMNAWLHSSGHRENILTADYKEIGIGYAGNETFQGYGGAALWAQEFGVRSPAAISRTPAESARAAAKPAPAKKHQRRRARRTS